MIRSQAPMYSECYKRPSKRHADRKADPSSASLAEYQQAKRAKQDPARLKALFHECWAASDSARAFRQALESRGYALAQGDRRGVVAVDFQGEVYAVAKWAGIKTKDLRARLGDGKDLPSVATVAADIAARMTDTLCRHIAESERQFQKRSAALAFHRAQLVERQRKERADLTAALERRWARESADRLNKGLRGLWDRITGRRAEQVRRNERETLESLRRDRAQKDSLIERHLDERESFHTLARQARSSHTREVEDLHRDIADYLHKGKDLPARDLSGKRNHTRDGLRGGRD